MMMMIIIIIIIISCFLCKLLLSAACPRSKDPDRLRAHNKYNAIIIVNRSIN